MSQFLAEIVHHILHHSLKLFPFLFITYLVMGLIEQMSSAKTHKLIQNAGRVGPVWGSVCGAFPQCGFSAAASYFYVGRVLTLGTLISVYMSTSDEMLPILISERVPVRTIAWIVVTKVMIGMITGFVIELTFGWLRKKERVPVQLSKSQMDPCTGCCDHKKGIVQNAFKHAVQVWIFITIVTLLIEIVVEGIGADMVSSMFSDTPILGEMIAALVGLIPNCGASVVITQLYLEGIIGTGPMLSGLLVSAGVGLLVLFKENKNTRENIWITAILYVSSVLWGVLFQALGIVF